MTNCVQKFGLEFGRTEYYEIGSYCRKKGIEWQKGYDEEERYMIKVLFLLASARK